MIAVCYRSGNVCWNIYPDGAVVDLSSDIPVIGGTTILSVDSSELIQYTDVTEMSSGVEMLKDSTYKVSLWRGEKFTYDGTTWGLNSSIAMHKCAGPEGCSTKNNYDATTCSGCNAALL